MNSQDKFFQGKKEKKMLILNKKNNVIKNKTC